jgi:hypothetical protein
MREAQIPWKSMRSFLFAWHLEVTYFMPRRRDPAVSSPSA